MLPPWRGWGTLALAGALALLPACGMLPWSPSSAAQVMFVQPVTWRGEVSCPGCNERWMTLTVFPDGLFRLSERFAGDTGGNEVFQDLGRWSLQGSSHLILRGRGSTPRHLRVLPDGRLRLLDSQGKALVGIRDYVLNRQAQLDLQTGPMRLLGFYIPEGRGAFTECLTSQVLPLAREGATQDMVNAYADLVRREHVKGPVLMDVTGRFLVPMPPRQAAGGLVVTRLERVVPGGTCLNGPMAPLQPLNETRWELLAVNGQPARAPVMGARAYLMLRPDGRLSGATGCNTLGGTYQQDGARLSFDRLVVTRMGCPGAAQVQEQAMLNAVRQTKQFRMVSNQLELSDGSQVLARFTAREMR